MDKFVTRKRKDACSSTSDDNRQKKRCTNVPKTKSNTDHGNDTVTTTTKPSTSKSHSTEPPTNKPPTTEPPCVEIESPARPVTEPPTPPATETLATEPPTIDSTVSEPPATEPAVTVPPATEDPPNTEAQSGASKKQAQKVKIDCFNDAWLTEKQFKNWLKKCTDTKGTTSAMCKYCLCTLIPHKSALIKHLQTAKHKKLVSNVETSKSISEMIKRPCEDAKKRAELKLAALIATKNLSFNLLDTLMPLLKDIFPDSEIAQKITLCRTKGQAVVKQILGPQCKETLVERLKTPGKFFSSVIDETTDITVKKQCALSVISFNDTTNTVETNFFDLYEVESGTGENLCTEMLNKFREQNIPLENLVGFAADTTNAMVGAHNSVFTHLKDEIPNIACVKCSAHSIHLVASKACLKLPRSIEDMLRNIGAHFSRSSQRKSRLTEIQKFFDEEIHTILSPCTTRWLSLKPCVDRVLEQKLVLIEYFTQELSHDPSITTDNILKALHNLYFTVYLEFMSHTLTIFNDFNRLFQSEKPLLHCLKSEVEKLLVNLCSNYIQIQYLKRTDIHRIDFENPGRFVPLQNVYLGVAAQQSLEEMKKSPNPPPMTEIEDILKKCLAFYIESVKEIKQRFKFDDPIYQCLEIVKPNVAQKFENKDMLDVITRFPVLSSHINHQELVKELREHAFLDFENLGLSTDMPADVYWKTLFLLKNSEGRERFPNLKKAISLLMVLPFSNACVERVFSKLKQIKTDHRNKLHTSTIAALMNTAEGTKESGLIKFEPNQKMLRAKLKKNT